MFCIKMSAINRRTSRKNDTMEIPEIVKESPKMLNKKVFDDLIAKRSPQKQFPELPNRFQERIERAEKIIKLTREITPKMQRKNKV